MTIASGTRLGPYEILSPLGAGGMGEVYRARDTRLKREVAVKVLPAAFSADPDRLRRFEQEALAASALNHPGILTVHDFGMQEGAPYIVTELLEGSTLREKLTGSALPARKTIDYALQIARGLAAAHSKGIVHRDLKPENLFVTSGNRVKILDFGLAKLTQPNTPGGPLTEVPTLTAGTGPGIAVGTVGYMSPEQVRGQPVDPRSDIFAFGAVLYEMATGERAFRKDSAIETLNAILKEEPREISSGGREVPPGLERVVRHCLEKDPEERFQSARDVAFDVETLARAADASVAVRPSRHAWPVRAAVGAILAAALAALSFRIGLVSGRRSAQGGVRFESASFRRGAIFGARFSPDGKTVFYAAAVEGGPLQLLERRADSDVPRALFSGGVSLLSVSRTGELAVLMRGRYMGHSIFVGTLARVPADGGAPREILEGVQEADWAPDGSALAIIRDASGKSRLEFPPGRVLCETAGYLSDPRFSPRGDAIAFFEHPVKWDDRGSVNLVDLQGRRRVLSEGWDSEEGLAFSPSGDEVLFASSGLGDPYAIRAVSRSGKVRTLIYGPGSLILKDVSTDGGLLVTRLKRRVSILFDSADGSTETDLSWLDYSFQPRLSADGKTLLFCEATQDNYTVCLRKTDGSPVVRLGEGRGEDLSPDGRSVVAIVFSRPSQLVLYPTGPGESRRLPRGPIESYHGARFFPDGKRILVNGSEAGRAARLWVQDAGGGEPRPVTADGWWHGLVAPDGLSFVARNRDGGFAVHALSDGRITPVSGLVPDDEPIRWSADGRALDVFRTSTLPGEVDRVDIASGRRTRLREILPKDRVGLTQVTNVTLADDGSCAYRSTHLPSDLYTVRGVR